MAHGRKVNDDRARECYWEIPFAFFMTLAITVSSFLTHSFMPKIRSRLTFVARNEALDFVARNVLIELQLADVERLNDGLVVQQQEARVAAHLVRQRVQVDLVLLRVLILVVFAFRGVVLRENTVRLQELVQRQAFLGS